MNKLSRLAKSSILLASLSLASCDTKKEIIYSGRIDDKSIDLIQVNCIFPTYSRSILEVGNGHGSIVYVDVRGDGILDFWESRGQFTNKYFVEDLKIGPAINKAREQYSNYLDHISMELSATALRDLDRFTR
jgi:hypothetical protein